MKSAAIFVFPVLFPLLLLVGCKENVGRDVILTREHVPVEVVRPKTHRELETFFAHRNYDWNSLDTAGVPPFILGQLPEDLDRIEGVTKKKRLFFLSLLPMVLMANGEVLRDRETLQELLSQHDAGEPLSLRQRTLIDYLVREYGLEEDPLSDRSIRKELLRRIDIIPPSLVLAQAATESAYGTSRFAREGNNLFGQWTFVPGTGLVPKRRPAGATYEVRRYPTLYDSLLSYIKNLNTHRAYRPLRDQRANMRAADQPLRGKDLARGLLRYSERREDYVRELRAIIRRNHLARLSEANLRQAAGPAGREKPSEASTGLLNSFEKASRREALRSDP